MSAVQARFGKSFPTFYDSIKRTSGTFANCMLGIVFAILAKKLLPKGDKPIEFVGLSRFCKQLLNLVAFFKETAMFTSILVPLDGSTFGEQALPWGLNIARRSKGQLQLLHVHRPLEATYAEMQIFDATLNQQIRDREKSYLDSTLTAVRAAAGGIPITAVNEDGEVAPTIAQHAQSEGTDLIVMMTHARGPMGRFWLGSVTDELMRSAPAPVLLVHPHDRETNLKADIAFRHVLIPLDGTPLAEQILAPAGNLANISGAEITLLRVVKPVMPMTMPAGVGSFGEMAHHMMERVDVLQAQLKKEAHDYLEKVAKKVRSQGLNVITQVAIEEQPGVAILHRAQAPIDLIALGTHGRRGLSRLFLGSVADKVIRGAHVPVLVQRPTS